MTNNHIMAIVAAAVGSLLGAGYHVSKGKRVYGICKGCNQPSKTNPCHKCATKRGTK